MQMRFISTLNVSLQATVVGGTLEPTVVLKYLLTATLSSCNLYYTICVYRGHPHPGNTVPPPFSPRAAAFQPSTHFPKPHPTISPSTMPEPSSPCVPLSQRQWRPSPHHPAFNDARTPSSPRAAPPQRQRRPSPRHYVPFSCATMPISTTPDPSSSNRLPHPMTHSSRGGGIRAIVTNGARAQTPSRLQ